MLVKEIMKRPFAIEKDISLAEAAHLMGGRNIGSLVLLEKDKIKGIITERDLMKNFGKHEKISHAMSTKVVTIEPDEPLDKAAELMRQNKIKRLPVQNNGKLVGMITMTDIMANFEALEEEFFFG